MQTSVVLLQSVMDDLHDYLIHVQLLSMVINGYAWLLMVINGDAKMLWIEIV